MMDLAELYQDVILDHSKQPRNYCPQRPPAANRHAEGYNLLCGDHIEVWAQVSDDQIEDVQFSGSACAICMASASMMTQTLKGKTSKTANVIFEQVRQMLTGSNPKGTDQSTLGKLAALAGVCRYPMRVKCATLPWHTFKAAIEDSGQSVTTE